jgi:tetratricopeptide (TPR) repeat protein
MTRLLSSVPFLLLLSCTPLATLRPTTDLLPYEVAKLGDAADRFYAATTPVELDAALAQARKVDPQHWLTRHIEAERALLDGNEEAAGEALCNALEDVSNDVPVLHLRMLFSLVPSARLEARQAAVCELLSESHPSHEVRARCAFRLALLSEARGEEGRARAARERVKGVLPLALVGPWDNDNGRGFDAPLPPEAGVKLDATYDGLLRKVRWRTDAVPGPAGVLDLAEHLEPSRHVLAYATGALELERARRVEVRIRTHEPFKLWVDGAPVAEVREVADATLDHFVVPLALSAGRHRVLLKSARRDAASWTLLVRVTGQEGTPLEGLSVLPADAEVPASQLPPLFEKVDAEARGLQLAVGTASFTARGEAFLATWRRSSGSKVSRLKSAERFTHALPGSLLAQMNLYAVLASSDDAGRAADVLAKVAAGPAGELTRVGVLRARAARLQGLKQRARTLLLALRGRGVPAVERELAELFESEGWTEESCDARRRLLALRPGEDGAEADLARCEQQLGHPAVARTVLDQALRGRPADVELLRARKSLAVLDGDLELGEKLSRELLRVAPWRVDHWMGLAELLERLGRRPEAVEALRRAMALKPDTSAPWNFLARLQLRDGNTAQAAASFREALERNPDDERMALRLDFLDPSANERLRREAPDEEALEALARKARALEPVRGANHAYLLDHEVAWFKPDGTLTSLVTQVQESFNAEGRDALLKQSLGGGRTRVYVAWALDQDGRRVEPVSMRDGTVRFRALGERSTVVLQYRREVSPRGYLARHLSTAWSFQGPNDYRAEARFVLLLPEGTTLHEAATGTLQRTERVEAGLRRVEWLAIQVPPVHAEPGMPPMRESALSLELSTVPSWDTFSEWMVALLQDADRASPETTRVAKSLFEGAETKDEKLLRIQAFLMKEIRYEQDYESLIAGVKPHPAPMVLERRYGDCKDKAVLFRTLAREAGVQTRYALVRTRDAGKVRRELPQQQFNHVIVYVPPQEGVTERCFDPTADALDVGTVRSDDVGTTSFVVDLDTKTWEWRDIPYQSTDAQRMEVALAVELQPDGSGSAQLDSKMVGDWASAWRRLARNPESFSRALQQRAASFFRGAEVQAGARAPVPDDVRSPAALAFSVKGPSLARAEGTQVRLQLPADVDPAAPFRMTERRHPLVLRTPSAYAWSGTVRLPGGRLARAPASKSVDSRCVRYTREVEPLADGVRFRHDLELRCERVAVADYPEALKSALEVKRLMEEELVLDAAPPAPPRVRAPRRADKEE